MARAATDEMKLWLSSPKFTFQANIDDDGDISWTAPVARKFIGQGLESLVRWLGRFGEVRVERLRPEAD